MKREPAVSNSSWTNRFAARANKFWLWRMHDSAGLTAGKGQADQGANVVRTIDEKIQYIAERELAAAIAKTHAMAGTVIIQNPGTGEILALANWPKFNPNSPNEVKNETRMNRAVSAIYEPGSTF